MHTTRRHHTRKTRRPLGGGAPPGRSRPGGRRAAAERPAGPAAVGRRPRGPFGGGAPGGISIASRCCFPHGMQTRETHYLSLTASGALILFTRGHKRNQKPRENPNLRNRKQNLEIHGTFSIARPSGKPASSVNFKVLLPILKLRIFAGFLVSLVTARKKYEGTERKIVNCGFSRFPLLLSSCDGNRLSFVKSS